MKLINIFGPQSNSCGSEKKGAFQMDEETIEQKIESDKVLTGILKDICCGIDRIADSFEWLNNNQNNNQNKKGT